MLCTLISFWTLLLIQRHILCETFSYLIYVLDFEQAVQPRALLWDSGPSLARWLTSCSSWNTHSLPRSANYVQMACNTYSIDPLSRIISFDPMDSVETMALPGLILQVALSLCGFGWPMALALLLCGFLVLFPWMLRIAVL